MTDMPWDESEDDPCVPTEAEAQTEAEQRGGDEQERAARAEVDWFVADVQGPMSLPDRVGYDARDAALDWRDPDQARTAAQVTREAVLGQVRVLYDAELRGRKARLEAHRTDKVTSSVVAPELAFLASAATALDALSDAVKAGAVEARSIAGEVVLDVEPERELGTATVKVGTEHGTVKATRTQATKPSVQDEAVVDVLVASLAGGLPEGTEPIVEGGYARGIRDGIAALLSLTSAPSWKTTALEALQRQLEAADEHDLAIRLGHAYGRVASGKPQTKLTYEAVPA